MGESRNAKTPSIGSAPPDGPSAVHSGDERHAFLFEHMLDGVAYCKMIEDEQGLPDWIYLDVNPAFGRLTGLSDAIGRRLTELIPEFRDTNPEVFEMYGRIARTGVPEGSDMYVSPLGLWLHVHANSPSPGHFLAVVEDISDRKQAEQALVRTGKHLEVANARLARTGRALRLLSLSDKALVRATDEDKLLQEVCDLVVKPGGYAMAWVGCSSHEPERSITAVAQAGAADYLGRVGELSWGPGVSGKVPMGACIREGRAVVISNLKTWKTRAHWKKEALALGLRSSLDLPIRADGVVVGALEIWATEINAFDADEVDLFEELADNLGFGISSLRAHRTKQRTAESLGVASLRLEQMVIDVAEAIGRVVEVRDPYTQGHQERVAGLAKLIAGEMGLPGEDVIAVEMTGLVHDVGKVKVPVEILTKPGVLDDVQYAIVKQHSRAGYDILKGIAFPWPVADIVLQHHERMDGSGYPEGLSGDAIGMLARILAVADVVEALSSHRPHRPAVGLDAAIVEIRESEGQFDPEVVLALMRLYVAGRIAL